MRIAVCIALSLSLAACAQTQDFHPPSWSLLPSSAAVPEKAPPSIVAYAAELDHEEEDEGLEVAPEGAMALGTKPDYTSELKSMFVSIAAQTGTQIERFGSPCRATSTVGGSFHPRCKALDAKVTGNVAAFIAEARKEAKARGYGGVGQYGGSGLVHLDVGPYCYWDGWKKGSNKKATNTIECDPARNAKRQAAAQRKQGGSRRTTAGVPAPFSWPG